MIQVNGYIKTYEINGKLDQHNINIKLNEQLVVNNGDVTGLRGIYNAGQSIQAYRMLIVGTDGRVYHADSSDWTHKGKVIGMSTHDAPENAQVLVIKRGPITKIAWGLSPNKNYYFNSVGELTLVEPTVIDQVVGMAVHTETFEININDPFNKEAAGVNPYIHEQAAPSTTWNIVHNLGRYPSGIKVIDSAGSIVFGFEKAVSVNQLTLEFSAPFSGYAYII
jgi:hypothetical protein